jgi:hypothetical protein
VLLALALTGDCLVGGLEMDYFFSGLVVVLLGKKFDERIV